MGGLSVITAARPDGLEHIDEAAASVAALKDSAPFGVEWVMCLDGPCGDAPEGPDEVICAPVRWGTAGARNIALAHAGGELVMPLDADDVVAAEGVASAVSKMTEAGLGWVSGNMTGAGDNEVPYWTESDVEWKPGDLGRRWTVPFAFHPNCVIARRELALRAGGWPAVDANEDLGFVFALSRLAEGRSLTEVILRYRSWEGQKTKSGHFPDSKELAFGFICATENAWRASAGLEPISAPDARGSQRLG